MLVHFLYHFDIKRTDVPLRMHAKFLYEPVDEKLIYLVPGGINASKQWLKIIYFFNFKCKAFIFIEIDLESINLSNKQTSISSNFFIFDFSFCFWVFCELFILQVSVDSVVISLTDGSESSFLWFLS